MVSSDFGKLEVQRHFSSGIDWAMAGMATPAAAAAAPVSPAALRNSRRFMGFLRGIFGLTGKVPNGGAALYHGSVSMNDAALQSFATNRGAPFRPNDCSPSGMLWG